GNLLERSAAPALSEASDAGWTVIVKEAMANGRLAHLDGAALVSALTQPWADIVLSGAATVDHLRSNVAAPDHDVDLDAFASIVEPPEQYWATRASLPWN